MAAQEERGTTVGLISLGCAKNRVDSERMLAEIAKSDSLRLSDAELCEVLVINTCAFIEPAIREALETVKWAVRRKTAGELSRVIVAGCLPQRLGKSLLKEVPGVDAIMGLARRDGIVEIIQTALRAKSPHAYLGPPSPGPSDDRERLLTTPANSAYLKISDGCSRKCAFCTIPAIRGPLRSKPLDLVLAEARELASAGVVELNLIAQDTTTYGLDLAGKTSLPSLLRRLEEIPGIRWIRLMYANPSGLTSELIEAIGASRTIVPYIDMPIQHIADRILKAMRRAETASMISKLVERLRRQIAGCVLRTTVIAGYPGETNEDFEQLLDFIRQARFEALGCFVFQPEAGTLAAEMPDQVSDEVKHERYDRLMLSQQEISLERNRSRIGTNLLCLVESSGPHGRGRFYGQAPEVDGVCLIRNCRVRPGGFVNVRVTGVDGYDLLSKPV